MSDKQKQAATIIHSHALGAGAIAAVFAQLAVVNIPASMGLLVNMFTRLVKNNNPEAEDPEEVAAAVGGLVIGFAGTTFVARSALGLVPVLGNAANAGMTFGLFEATGWGLYAVLEEGRDITDMTAKEFKKYVKIGQSRKIDMNAVINRLPPHDRVEYDRLVEALKQKDLSDDERARIQDEIQALLDPHM